MFKIHVKTFFILRRCKHSNLYDMLNPDHSSQPNHQAKTLALPSHAGKNLLPFQKNTDQGNPRKKRLTSILFLSLCKNSRENHLPVWVVMGYGLISGSAATSSWYQVWTQGKFPGRRTGTLKPSSCFLCTSHQLFLTFWAVSIFSCFCSLIFKFL